MGSEVPLTFTLPFRPSLLIGPEACNDRNKLHRWLRHLGLPSSSRPANILRARLLEGMGLLHKAGTLLYYQPARPQGMKPEDLAPPSLIPETELEHALEQAPLGPFFHQNATMMETAYANKVVLKGFRLREFLQNFHKKAPPIKEGGPYEGRDWIYFRRKDGPRLLVDEDNEILVIYLPEYLTEENRSQVGEALESFSDQVRPTPDAGCQDRRANKEASTNPAKEVSEMWDDWIEGRSSQPPVAASQHHCLAWIARGQAG
ncbi:hypothetical protein FRC08_009310, partial [Ceratobasidium sp. 394]